MDLDSKTEKKIQDLQAIEQNLQAFLSQKQSFQIELNEVNNALAELKKSGDEVYKILSNIMVKSNKKDLDIELNEKKKILDLRINSIEKQEKLIEESALKLRNEINEAISKGNVKE